MKIKEKINKQIILMVSVYHTCTCNYTVHNIYTYIHTQY